MYQTEHGKSTLRTWEEQQREVKKRKVELTKLATALVTLERRSILEAVAADDIEQVLAYIKPIMLQELEAHDFGSYCHEGRDLLEDTLHMLNYLKTDTFSDNLMGMLEYEASNIAYELEGAFCDFCSEDCDVMTDEDERISTAESNSAASTKSSLFLNQSFPLVGHPQEEMIRRFVQESLFNENANSMTGREWTDDAAWYTRSDWSMISTELETWGITLEPKDSDKLMEFASDYASLVDGEEDKAELDAIRKEGDK